MLKAEATDMKFFPLLYRFSNMKEIKEIYEQAKSYEVPGNIENSVTDEIHKKIDAIVYEYLEFSLDEQKYIEKQLIDAVKRRTEKSKTSGKC